MFSWQLTKSFLAAFSFGLIFYVVIPTALILAANVFLSAASVLDPLNAGKHLENIWKSFAVILIFKIIFSVFASVFVGFSTNFLVNKIESGWVYLASAGSSLIFHLLITAFLTIGFYLGTKNEIFITYIIFMLIFVFILAPLMGIICTFFTR